MIYSVYNYGSRGFDYYEAAEKPTAHAGKPTGSSFFGGSGENGKPIAPEQAAWRVPVGARRAGSGPTPKGRIAALGELDGFDSTTSILALGVIGYFAYKFWKG